MRHRPISFLHEGRRTGTHRAAFCALVLLGLLSLTGCCDPSAHINLRNNYAFPVNVHLPANAARHIPDQMLDTVPAGRRVELANSTTMDGDIDYIQIEDAHGRVPVCHNDMRENAVRKVL